jgi:hypothetical protein
VNISTNIKRTLLPPGALDAYVQGPISFASEAFSQIRSIPYKFKGPTSIFVSEGPTSIFLRFLTNLKI